MRGSVGLLFVLFLVFFYPPALTSCKAVVTAPPQKERSFAAVDDFLYQLRNVDLDLVGKSGYDLAIIDYSKDGSAEGKWKASEISSVKAKGAFILAYLSIGEAESHRSYWQPLYTPGNPSWLGRRNPDRPSSYKVKYWYAEWKKIVKDYLSEIAAQDFDGVYLDLADAYEYWSDVGNGESELLTTVDAADRMESFVKELADYARKDLGKISFIVCPQNGTGMMEDASDSSAYAESIDAVGAEDTYFFGDSGIDNAWNPRSDVIGNLDSFRSEGKKVFVVEYLSKGNSTAVRSFYEAARLKGYVPFATSRELDTLRVNSGFEPD